MPKKTYGAEEARTQLPKLLERAHHGEVSLVTKRGKLYAAIVPVARAISSGRTSASLLELKGTGAGLWGHDPAASVRATRDEWS